MRKNRGVKGDLIRPEVYLDESYVNKNHSKDFTWYFGEDGPMIQKPTGKGERLIILNAVTSNGWVPSAKLIFKSSRKTGDYHGQMNGKLFQKWFQDRLLPNIPENSLIVMDNASYHNTLTASSPPTRRCAKEKIKSWLAQEGIPCADSSLKAELVEVLLQRAPIPIYEIDDTARKLGHEVVRTPPYHPELQPIEICWGVVKNHVARNCDFTMKNLQLQLEAGFSKVSGATCKKIVAKVRKIEDEYWSEDSKHDPSDG
jgi:transposase